MRLMHSYCGLNLNIYYFYITTKFLLAFLLEFIGMAVILKKKKNRSASG